MVKGTHTVPRPQVHDHVVNVHHAHFVYLAPYLCNTIANTTSGFPYLPPLMSMLETLWLALPRTERVSTTLVIAILVSNSTILLMDHGGINHVHTSKLLLGLLGLTALIGTIAMVWRHQVVYRRASRPLPVLALPLGVVLHGLSDGVLLGTAWHLGLWQGLIATAALLLHEIPHLWAQHRIWKISRPTARRGVLWLVGFSFAGWMVGLVIHSLLDTQFIMVSHLQYLLVWVLTAVLVGLGSWTWNHEFGYQPVRIQLWWLLVGFSFSIPLALLHLLAHSHAH